jgi:hypothetical protein
MRDPKKRKRRHLKLEIKDLLLPWLMEEVE